MANQTMVLADIPERVRLREIRQALARERDRIADMDFELSELRQSLGQFEAHYETRLGVENHALQRVESLTRHLERWVEILQSKGQQVVTKGCRAQEYRQAQLKQQHCAASISNTEDPSPKNSTEQSVGGATSVPTDRELKAAYRALARRFHPDLARTEQEQLQLSQMMARIIALYRAGDVEQLTAMQQQAKGAELEDAELSCEEQIEKLNQRLTWFQTTYDNLKDERSQLEATPTCTMMRSVAEAHTHNRDLLEELRCALQIQVTEAYNDVRDAVALVEDAVAQYNKHSSSNLQKTSGTAMAREQDFDPFGEKKQLQRGLQAAATTGVSKEVTEHARWLVQCCGEQPALGRLILMTHIAELSPFPLDGLESFDAIEARHIALCHDDDQAPSLAQALVELDDLLEFGVRHGQPQVAHLGLRFISETTRAAAPIALQRFAPRRRFREILGVLSAEAHCEQCNHEVFPVPLLRLRGIDNLRAKVCPECGNNLARYWMPKGQDVQSVLNPAFIDFEIIREWSFHLARTHFAVQLVPCEVERMTLGDLKKQIVADLFARHEVPVGRSQIQIYGDQKRLPERTQLGAMETQSLELRFTKEASINEIDAAAMLRHRIRSRFKA